jgi:hypothetical protein
MTKYEIKYSEISLNVRIPSNVGKTLSSCTPGVSEEGLISMEFVKEELHARTLQKQIAHKTVSCKRRRAESNISDQPRSF